MKEEADVPSRIGRKPILRLAYGGFIAQFLWTFLVLWRWDVIPIELVLVTPLFAVAGGGVDVAIAVTYSIVADVTAERQAVRFPRPMISLGPFPD